MAGKVLQTLKEIGHDSISISSFDWILQYMLNSEIFCGLPDIVGGFIVAQAKIRGPKLD